MLNLRRSLISLCLLLTTLLCGCAYSPVDKPLHVSDVIVQLPAAEHWKVLDVNQKYDTDTPTIAFAQIEPKNPERINSIFRLSVLPLTKVEPFLEGADECLAYLAKFASSFPNQKSVSGFAPNVRGDCTITQPGNEYRANLFEKNEGALKEISEKVGLQFASRGVGSFTISSKYGASRRLLIVGYVVMSQTEGKPPVPTESAKKQLAEFSKAVLLSLKGAASSEAFTLQFPTLPLVNDVAK
jgi:hypothetical protein